MDRELSTCLPFGEFVEAAIARASASGVLQIVGAGDVQFLYLKSPDVQSTILSVSGPWLGLAGTINIPRECVDVDLTASGSEIVLATDGLYDQPDEKRVRLGRGDLLSTLSKIDVGTTLYEATKHAYLVATAQSRRQHDDTTILSLRRL
jgi:serine phosphatase RsbU (regulator of sigma subunit)